MGGWGNARISPLLSLSLYIQPFFSTCYALCNIRNQKRASEHLCEEAAQHFAHVGELTTAAGILLVACIRTPPWMGGNKIKKELDSVWLFCWVGAKGFFFTGTSYDPGEILNGRELHRPPRRWAECVTKHN